MYDNCLNVRSVRKTNCPFESVYFMHCILYKVATINEPSKFFTRFNEGENQNMKKNFRKIQSSLFNTKESEIVYFCLNICSFISTINMIVVSSESHLLAGNRWSILADNAIKIFFLQIKKYFTK